MKIEIAGDGIVGLCVHVAPKRATLCLCTTRISQGVAPRNRADHRGPTPNTTIEEVKAVEAGRQYVAGILSRLNDIKTMLENDIAGSEAGVKRAASDAETTGGAGILCELRTAAVSAEGLTTR